MKKSRTPPKVYERRIDLTAYHGLLRFIRGMHPGLSAADVLRMLPEVETWTTEELSKRARILDQAVESLPKHYAYSMERVWGHSRTVTVAEFVPYIVIGRWKWPSWPTLRSSTGASIPPPLRYPLPGILGWVPHGYPEAALVRELLHLGRYADSPVLLEGNPPTTAGLCKLADDLRETLQDMQEQGRFAVLGRVNDEIEGRVIKALHWERSLKGEGKVFYRDEVADQDFRVYCFGLLAQFLAESHGWRLVRCLQCDGLFLKTRRDPPGRPSRFCSEPCRRDWHNPRRPKRGNPR
jgi:hypothetical protein